MPFIGTSGAGLQKKSSGARMLERAYTALPKVNAEEKARLENAKAKAKFRENKAAGLAELKSASGELLRASGRLCEAEIMSDRDFKKEVEGFVQSYSLTCKAVEHSDRFVSGKSVDMESVTGSYKKALEKVGIYPEGENMTVHEDELARNMGEAKKLFGSRFSYGRRIAQKAAELRSLAVKAENVTGIYDRTGSGL
ncbi:MAG: hypothetical protein K2K57_11315 [Oscillospiraceae bacterium]|nr:hypothetical protein [Oscillospiraceae bacterium]